MSPLGLIPHKLPEVGRIRLGTRELSKSGKLIPATSDLLIFSSESKGTLLRLASIVGGTVERWDGGPDQWRVVSTVSSYPVQVPPQMLKEPMFELWSAAGCLRRCDGETCEYPSDTPDGPVMMTRSCLCDAGAPECKPTTRLSVVLPAVPGVGVWVVTTHSGIAAQELAGQMRLLELSHATGLVPATIAIEHEQTRKGATVPVLRLRFHIGLNELQQRDEPVGELGAGS